MSIFLGVDVGTTKLGAVALELGETVQVFVRHGIPNTAAYTLPGHPERAELDLHVLARLVTQLLAETAQRLGTRTGEVTGIGVTGQQHGLALLSPEGSPLAPAVTWQDRRTLDVMPGSMATYLERYIAQAGGPEAFDPCGCLPAAGYLGPTLFWLQANGLLPKQPALACLIPDATASLLAGAPPCTDATDGGSSGLLDITRGTWHRPAIERLGLPAELFPPVRPTGAPLGGLTADMAAATGFTAGTPIGVAMGDNQASFLGSVHQAESVLLNVGTGAQISALADGFHRLPGLDTRAFPDGRYLLVGAGMFGGRVYADLHDFFRAVGQAFFGASDGQVLYAEMARLGTTVPPGADGLRCDPYFAGSRADPNRRGCFANVSTANLTPGHLVRALLEGMAEAFYGFYQVMQPALPGGAAAAPSALIGSGNGIRRNRLLSEILARRFGAPLAVPGWEEEAAVGAALSAAAGGGTIRWAQVPDLIQLGQVVDTEMA
ncbi:MAG: sedoheptulokinase [Anaerolineae bacterium]